MGYRIKLISTGKNPALKEDFKYNVNFISAAAYEINIGNARLHDDNPKPIKEAVNKELKSLKSTKKETK